MKEYKKPALSIKEQIDLLKKRNIVIDNVEDANVFLKFNNYYRFSPYWKIIDKDNHVQNKITFTEVKNRYLVDQKLRNILLKYLKIIEISLKTQFSYQLSNLYNDPHFYVKNIHFEDKNSLKISETLANLKSNIDRSNSKHAIHYRDNYLEDFPPSWVAIEEMTFGSFSRFVQCLKTEEAKNAFVSEFSVNYSILNNWIKTFVGLRNLCAHNAVLFNQNINLPLKTKKQKNRNKHIPLKEYLVYNNKIFDLILLLSYFLKDIKQSNSFKSEIIRLFKSEENNLSFYGFPKNYQNFLKSI